MDIQLPIFLEPSEGEPLRIEDIAELEDGFARKVLYRDPRDDSPQEVAICRYEGRLFALDSLCPHEGGRISGGPLMDGRYMFCPLHLYKFDPASGAAIDVSCPDAKTFEVREVDGVALVYVDSAGGAGKVE